MNVKIKKLHPAAIIPQYATPGSGCVDLHALLEDQDGIMVGVSNPVSFRTGLAIEVPEGWVLKIYSRSGSGFKNDTRLSNCVGIIDSDYRGELHVKLTKDPSINTPLIVSHGDRIAQAMLVRAERMEFEVVDELSDTERGAGGFGSTGK